MAFGFVFLRFKDVATGRSVDICCEDATAHRSVVVTDMEPCAEVARRTRKGGAETDDHRQEPGGLSGRRGRANGRRECSEFVVELHALSVMTSSRGPAGVRANIARVRACWHELPRPAAGIHGCIVRVRAVRPSAYGNHRGGRQMASCAD